MLLKFSYRVFYNEETGYSVCIYKDMHTGNKVKCIGSYLPNISNITYDFDVEICYDKYGVSYKVIDWKEIINETEEDIINYLSSGLFAGISKKTAIKIYNKFEKDTLNVLDTDIDRLSEVSGIGAKTIIKIKKSYVENTTKREIAKKLLKYGITANAINRVHKEFKSDAITIIDEKPYELCNIRGITFQIADMIAKDRGFPEDCYARIKAASNHVLTTDMLNGNVCMEKVKYALALIKTLDTELINTKNVLEFVIKMIKDGTIKYNKRNIHDKVTEYFYYPKTYYAERNIATNIKKIINQPKIEIPDIDNLIKKYAKTINLDESQKNAIRLGVSEPIFIITGGPGTGKTTILKIIAQINEEINGKNINVFLSPTGRAARRITESTGFPAKTIHSALGLGVIDDERFVDEGFNDENIIEDSKIIVDEASMIDLWTMDGLLRNIKKSSLGLIGDIDQLPSVRCGSILRDLIDCGIIPCARLEKFHRQSNDAETICINAQNIKQGKHILNQNTDFIIVNATNLEDTEDKIVEAALSDIETYGLDNVKILCPFKKGLGGVYNINNILQGKINKNVVSAGVKIPNGMTLYIGDPVMQLKNIEEVSNGDIGYVTDITEEKVQVTYSTINGDVTVIYPYADAKEQLTLAYATTVHKSQGSEYDAVIMPLTSEHGIMKKRNILYTGITRGRHKVTLLGTNDSFFAAIDNNMIEDRHSMLSVLLNPKLNKINSVIPCEKKPEYRQYTLADY